MKNKKWGLSVLGLFIVVIFLFPMYWMVLSSLRPSGQLLGNTNIFPADISFESYANIFNRDYPLMTYFKNSFIIAIGVTFGNLLLAAPAAYALARKKLYGLIILILFILVIQMFPSNMLALPLYSLFSQFQLLNSYIGIIIANMTLSLPFVILILRTYYLYIPSDLEEAALLDGCSKWRAFYSVILPLVKPGLFTCAAFSFVLAWGEFLYALTLLKDNNLWTITLGMREFSGQFGTRWGDLMAISVISSLPVVIIFIITQRYIVGGITAGTGK
ncbi:carbohydrate ABC transporter permease [Alteribacillus sp. HJP-4]|uniref:carbohydrate ABC transporter permease n=1 Tax=Alteribacillus sp. HJP-4 TaxID=2775394 RepID=UPI0035CCCA81